MDDLKQYVYIKDTDTIDFSIENNCYRILIIMEGVINLLLDGREKTINSPCCICINQDTDIRLLKFERVKIRTIDFLPTLFFEENVIISPRNNFSSKLSYKQLEVLFYDNILINTSKRDIRAIINYSNICKQFVPYQDMLVNIINIRKYIMLIIFALEETIPSNSLYFDDREVFDLITCYIKTNLREHITLSNLSRYFYININKIEDLFKKYENKTYGQFCNDVRIDSAKKLLLNTNNNIDEISYLLGFSNAQNFIRFFKKQTGVAPYKYRMSGSMIG